MGQDRTGRSHHAVPQGRFWRDLCPDSTDIEYLPWTSRMVHFLVFSRQVNRRRFAELVFRGT